MPNGPDMRSEEVVFDSPLLAYMYDGSFEGFLTCVFDAYALKESPDVITIEKHHQPTLNERIVFIETSVEKAHRVDAGIKRSIGELGHYKAQKVFLSDDIDREVKLFRYLVYGFLSNKKIHKHLTHPDVVPVEDICVAVGRERERMLQFVRFSHMENGIYFAKVNPNQNVIPLVMDHFATRFNVQPFVIYDEVHHVAGIYDTKTWEIVYTDQLQLPDVHEEERQYQRMWKTFYDTVAIKERTNHKQRQNFMPKRFWSNLTEMTYTENDKKNAKFLPK